MVHPLSDGVGWGIVEGRMAEGMNLDDLANEYVSKAAVLAQKGDCYDAEGHLLYAVGTGNIMRLPAADVKPVVHGKWEWNPDGMDWGLGAWVCGKCKSRPETWWQTVKECYPLRCAGSRFCPNCGADMWPEEKPIPDPKSTFYDLLYEEGGANTT